MSPHLAAILSITARHWSVPRLGAQARCTRGERVQLRVVRRPPAEVHEAPRVGRRAGAMR